MKQAEFVTLTVLLMLSPCLLLSSIFSLFVFTSMNPLVSPSALLAWRSTDHEDCRLHHFQKKNIPTPQFVPPTIHPITHSLSLMHMCGLRTVTNLTDSWDLLLKWNGLFSQSSSTLQSNFSYNCSLPISIRRWSAYCWVKYSEEDTGGKKCLEEIKSL